MQAWPMPNGSAARLSDLIVKRIYCARLSYHSHSGANSIGAHRVCVLCARAGSCGTHCNGHWSHAIVFLFGKMCKVGKYYLLLLVGRLLL